MQRSHSVHASQTHLSISVTRLYLQVDEIEVFHTVQRYLAYNKPNPKEKAELVKCIRLSEIPTDLSSNKVVASGLFPKNVVGLAIVSQGGSFQGEDAMPRGRFGKCV